MRFSTVIVPIALFASASATSLLRRQSLPTCALPCIASADFGSCSSTDDTCLCRSSAFVTSVTTCIETSCTGSDLQNALLAAQSLCDSVGVTLTTDASLASLTASLASSISASAAHASTTSPAASSGAATPTSSNGALSTLNAGLLSGVVGAGLIALAL